MKPLVILCLAVSLLPAQSWTQWGQNPQHTGAVGVSGQKLEKVYDKFQYDLLADAIRKEYGDLLVHYMAPIVDGDDVFMMQRVGDWVSCRDNAPPCGPDVWADMEWSVVKLKWVDGKLAVKWVAQTDWQPIPDNGSHWEPVFHPVLSGKFLYIPSLGGVLLKVDRETGEQVDVLNPFENLDSNIYVTGPIAADKDGNLFYNTMKVHPFEPWTRDAMGAWLVRVGADGRITSQTFQNLVPGAPAADAECFTIFNSFSLPWPPSPTALPDTYTCGSERPGVNVAPAIAPDGTIYTVSRAHFNPSYGYLVAVNPDLTPKWTASLRDRLNDGCGVSLPDNGAKGGCREGATPGVDPATNMKPAGHVNDLSTASPVVTPDGASLYGAYTRYNSARGHLFKFSPAGDLLAAFDFGWDTTPAVFAHDGTYSVMLKSNHYGIPSYCGNPEFCLPDEEKYELVSLNANLQPEWKFLSTNNMACETLADGTQKCTPHSAGFEWCVNMVAVDQDGVMYANSEDGNVYAVDRNGKLVGNIFLQLAVGAAYTPLAIGPDGKIYTQNAGALFVVGKAERAPAPAAAAIAPMAKSPSLR